MVGLWTGPIKALGFDGIHWDTLGRIAGNYEAEKSGIHAFLHTAHGLLQNQDLRQTMNMVDLAWWDPEIVKKYLEFPYGEMWSNDALNHYYAEMDRPELSGIRGVFSMYPSVKVPEGWTSTDVICARHREGRRHHLAYLIVGDGARHMKNEYWPDTAALNDLENACLRSAGSPVMR